MVLNLKKFSDQLHYEIKVQAAIEKMPMKDWIEKALWEYLKTVKTKGGKP